MSSVEVDLCVSILDDHFGYYVAAVGKLLLSNHFPLPLIVRNIKPKMTSKEIKRSLAIMEHHNLLDFRYMGRGSIIYSVSVNSVMRLTRILPVTLIVKTLFGNVGEALFEEVVSMGKLTCSDCLKRVTLRLGKGITETKLAFSSLLDAQILIRCPMLFSEEDGIPVFEDLTDAFKMPDKIFMPDVKIEVETEQLPDTRKRKFTDGKMIEEDSRKPDAKILWRVNWPRMERFLRDELVVDAIEQNYFCDKNAIYVARLLIKVGEMNSEIFALQSNPIALQDVCLYAKSNRVKIDREIIGKQLTILSTETDGIIRRIGDSGGGLYVINYEKAVELLCYSHIESAIREKLGDNCLRIFRLLRSKGFLEEDQIEKAAMLSSKEAKNVCYSLVDSNFITIRPIARTNDFAPARTLFLYGISLSSLLSSLIMFTSKSMRNAILRRNHEMKANEALIDRQLKMETIIANIECNSSLDGESKKQQIKEVEEAYMTAGDKSEFAKYKVGQQALCKLEIELERVLFLLQQYQRIRRTNSLEQMHQRKPRRKPKSILDSFNQV